ncbi:DUF3606 domain-containing protein [Rhizobium sp. LjRoot98]|uniref:DUF3606 domain-containing protein n=1 Tax=Rhizobium sp. LjRoot98 TaxID=3342345 RepID=UPI003F4FBE7E
MLIVSRGRRNLKGREELSRFRNGVLKMATGTRGRNQDRARVAAGQHHELSYEAKKEVLSKAQVKEAVNVAGDNRSMVEEKLEK